MESSSARAALRGTAARESIIDAARRQFLADGLHKTSVESITRAAGVSRPTFYAHFADKVDVFRTIVAALHDRQFAAMQDAAVTPGPIEQRLVAVLAARFTPFVKLTSSSRHGAELLDENSRVCGDITSASRQRSLQVLRRLIDHGVRDGEIDLGPLNLGAMAVAGVVYDCARGAKEDPTTTPAAYRTRLRDLVAVLLSGLRPRPGP